MSHGALDRLYASTIVLVIRASAELDSELMRRAAKLLQPVRDSWETNANQRPNDHKTPVPASRSFNRQAAV